MKSAISAFQLQLNPINTNNQLCQQNAALGTKPRKFPSQPQLIPCCVTTPEINQKKLRCLSYDDNNDESPQNITCETQKLGLRLRRTNSGLSPNSVTTKASDNDSDMAFGEEQKVVVCADQQPFSSLRDFMRVVKVGEGSFGQVFRAYHQSHDESKRCTVYALKSCSGTVFQGQGMSQLGNELEMLRKLKGPGIINLAGNFQDKEKAFLVLDYALNGDFESFLSTNRITTFATRQFYAASIVSILGCLRQNKVVHRDLKPANLLMNERFQLVLGDFGSARTVSAWKGLLPTTEKTSLRSSLFEQNSSGPSGTADYIAPEAIDSTEVSFAADYWALGVIVWQLFNDVSHKATPFDADNVAGTFERIKNADYKMPQCAGDAEVPEVALDLIRSLLELDPTKRLGATDFVDLLSHPFFEGVDFASLHSFDKEAPLLPRQKKLSAQKVQEKKFLPVRVEVEALPIIVEEAPLIKQEEPKSPIHPDLLHYNEDDVELRSVVRKRSRLILKLQRELVLLKDNSFAYFTCDGKMTLKKHFQKSQILEASVVKGDQLKLSVALSATKRTNYLFYFTDGEQAQQWAAQLQ